MSARDRIDAEFRTGAGDLLAALAFLTRIPLPAALRPAYGRPDFTAAGWAIPVVGGLIGLVGGIAFVLATALTLPPLLAAALSVAITAYLTGAMHEDGLADTVDGFGGTTQAERLEIMRDSRIGAYGAVALILAILLRVAAVEALGWRAQYGVVLALVAAEAVSRGALVRFWYDLPAARPEGLSHAVGRPGRRAMIGALAASAALALFAIPAIGPAAVVVALLGTAAATVAFTRLARDRFGGQTGDTLGAMQQIGVAVFLVLAAAFA